MTLLRSQKIGGVRYIRKAVREALEAEGELAIYYQMYNPQNSAGVPRCTHCLNGAYQQSDWGASMICPYCFGTTFAGGIRQAWFTPLLFSKPDVRDEHHPYGDLAEQTSDLYLPDFISAWKGDFAVRINGLVWTARSEDGSVIEKDTFVIVKEIRGNKVVVNKE